MDNPFKPAEKYQPAAVVITALFSFIGIAFLGILNQNLFFEGLRNQYIVASFGSTAVLIYAVPKAAFSKPKNVFFSHIFSAFFSIIVAVSFDSAGLLQSYNWLVCGICVTGAILIMMFTGTIHPPAGATALTVAISQITDFQFLVFPLAIGLLFMMAVAYAAVYCRDRCSKSSD